MHSWRAFACSLALAAGTAPGGAAGPAGSGAPEATGRDADLPRHELILSRHSDAERKDYDVWRMCGDGTQLASLVVLPGHQIQLAVSPDGEELLYTDRASGKGEVWRRPFGRGEPVNLTAHPADDSASAWSPDGRRIAFFSDRDGGRPELYLLDLESGELERRTENDFHDSGAAWSPDGAWLVLTRFFPAPEGGDHQGRGEIVRLDLATGEETQLTDLGGFNGGLSVSPDSGTIAFHRSAEEGVEIWLMDADGTDPRAITDTFVDEYSPEWSPDGRWIAFSAGVGHDGLGTFDLWLMRPDGSDRRLLHAGANTEAWHKWRPGDHFCR
jgi:TolB protein